VGRRDGISACEARARQLPSHQLSHAPNPDLAFRLCSDRKGWDLLLPSDAELASRLLTGQPRCRSVGR
jgi:hypothetical protein